MKISEEFYNDLIYLIEEKIELRIASTLNRDTSHEWLQFNITEKEFKDNYVEKRNKNEVR
jgi:hypothetical protein